MSEQNFKKLTIDAQYFLSITEKIRESLKEGGDAIYSVTDIRKVMQLGAYLAGAQLPIQLSVTNSQAEISDSLQALMLVRGNEERKKLMEAFTSTINGMEKDDILKVIYGVRCLIFDTKISKNDEGFCNPFSTPIKDWGNGINKTPYGMIQYFNPKTGEVISESEYNRLSSDDKQLHEARRIYVLVDKDGQNITVKQDDWTYLEVLAKMDIEKHPKMLLHYINATGKDCNDLPGGGATYELRHVIADIMESKANEYPEFVKNGVLYNAVLTGALKNSWHTGIAIVLTLESGVDLEVLAKMSDEKLNFYLNIIEQICIKTAEIPDKALGSYRNSDGSFLPGANPEGEIIKTGTTTVEQKRAYLQQIGKNLLDQFHKGLRERNDLWTNPTMMRLNQLCFTIFQQPT